MIQNREKVDFSLSVGKYRELLLSPMQWHGIGVTLWKFYNQDVLCDGQGTVRQAILYVDKLIFSNIVTYMYLDTESARSENS